MRTRAFAICLLLLLTIVPFTSIFSAQGLETGEWISKYRVEDLNSGQLLMEVDFETGTNTTYGSIFGGAELNVTFTINVPISQPTASLKIATSMLHSAVQDRYWELVTTDYVLSNYNPNEASVHFVPVAGDLVMSCFGRIPTTTGSTKPAPFLLIMLTDPSGATLDQIKPYVINAKMDEYQTLLQQKEDKLLSLKNGGVDATYIQLYENVLNQSKAQAAQGEAANAIALLNSLPASDEPVTSNWELLFFPAVGVLTALVVVFGFVFMRARGKIKYVNLVIEDQIKDLEGLTLRASKVDRTFSSSLESVKDKLKSLVGM